MKRNKYATVGTNVGEIQNLDRRGYFSIRLSGGRGRLVKSTRDKRMEAMMNPCNLFGKKKGV